MLILDTLVAVYIGNNLTEDRSPRTPTTRNIDTDIKEKTNIFQNIIPFLMFPFVIGINNPIAGMQDILEIINIIPSVKDSYPL